MAEKEPVAEVKPQSSSPDAVSPTWTEASEHLEQAEIYWISTVRPDGRPHVTPLLALWLDGALYFTIGGSSERKARNLAQNPQCILTTGCNSLSGLDLVVEGEAERVEEDALLQRLADRYEAKYGSAWRFTVGDVLVYKVAPATVFGFGKGASPSQIRWRF